ncbi:DNA polymerase IV [Serinibacter arcticus]|uniref:Y-family DNA polymerase n=1 Tax=Serinibacter arcticus TaxID=1655435 RepID=UPI001304B058|nr:DNA polymerase IV [Serinibacter arcticus]
MTRGPLLHADADAFFASVALRTRPELIDRPVAVVAHVVVACASYPARARGVRAGMHVDEAQTRCPGLVMLDVPQAEIEEVGDALLALFHEHAAAVEPGSIEEAFLDTGAADVEEAVAVARSLRRRAATELGIPLTVGVGRTKLMAKLASRAGKPDGLHVIDAAREAELRSTLAPSEIWGIGPRTVARLGDLGVVTLADVDRVAPAELHQTCGTAMARRLLQIREGTDDAVVRPVTRRASFSASGATAGYARPDRTPQELLETCVGRVCHRAERSGLAGSVLAVTLTPETGERVRVLRTGVPEATAEPATWSPLARDLLERAPVPRLTGLGVTLERLVPVDQVQGALF